MMRVQLIRYHDVGNVNTRLAQSLNKRQGVLPPLGIAYIASALEAAGHIVDLIDAIALALSKEEVQTRIRDFAPDMVGVTAMTPTIRGALEAAQLAKDEGAMTVVGGVHMSIFPHETLRYPQVDFGIVGEGEHTIVELCDALERDGTFSSIPGVCYKKPDGEIVVGLPRIVDDVSSLPWPAYHLLPMERYSSIIGQSPVTTMMGSRGCPYKCGFCFKTPSDKKYRTRDVTQIVDEIEFVIDRYGVREVMFYDDIMPPKYAGALSREIIDRNVKIKWQTPQRVNLVDPELLELMAQAGCHILRYGVEQGDPEMMRYVEKKTHLPQVKSAFDWAKNAGIDTFAYFIIGYINETEKTMRATIDLAKELDPRYVMFTKAVPLPNTPLMFEAVKQGFVDSDY
ncbi:MAG: radical SAM protein, partial [Gammaproteobacteria bacterium]|nr:radical SAM protein [Gammaproteobacteria bacterium]